MARTVIRSVDAQLTATTLWPEVARRSAAWLHQHGSAVRDSIVLLPYSALLPHARQAFAALGGWQPRIETTLTLSASIGPPPAALPGAVCGDTVAARLQASRVLMRQPWGQAWARRDRRGFEGLVAQVVDAAQGLMRAALARPLDAREAFWVATEQQLSGVTTGPGALENLLLRVAVQWAALGTTAATDSLFSLRPAAWIVLRIGGADEFAEAVLASAVCPALRLDADPPADEPFATFTHAAAPQRWVCNGFEAEAQAAAAEVIHALNKGRTPVALVALDRELMRRIRSLLARQSVVINDETGWRLSTTRAAARVMSLLRAAEPGSTEDARLQWLKCLPLEAGAARLLVVLEALWRGERKLPPEATVDAAKRWWSQQFLLLQSIGDGRERPLAEWLQVLHQTRSLWVIDEETFQLQRALHIGDQQAAWIEAAHNTRFDLAGFTAWVDGVLDAGNFEPPPAAQAEVVLTPLARAIGRPFAHVVVPGADPVHLGNSVPRPSLIGDALAKSLGLDHALRRQQRERQAFAQLLRVPKLTLLRRRADGAEPLAASPLVEWLALSRAKPLAEQDWRAPQKSVHRFGQTRPLPVAPEALPPSLSASTVEALRQCPYRFFARSVLRLEESTELDTALSKRDYGNWLHEVLHRFHRHRHGVEGDDFAQLQVAAYEATSHLRLDAAELLPFQASFEHFVPAYLAWLQGREAQGWLWLDGEKDLTASPPVLFPQVLRGRIDRLDQGPTGAVQILDYKTGSSADLAKRVKTPLEDTQLPFYAALATADQPEGTALSAAYLALDDAQAPLEIHHPEVANTAAEMVDGLAADFAQLRAGAAMPALGEGRVCETCEARGLCRRDHWAALL